MNENHLREDLQILEDAILNSPKNPFIAHLNLNSLKNKINYIRILIQDIPLDYFVLSETKLDKSFPTAQFRIPGYEKRARNDQNKYGGGLIEYVKKGVICKRIQKLKMLTNESVFSELTIAKKKWLYLGIYRPPTPENLVSLFEELTDSLSKRSEFYKNFIILSDVNLDVKLADRELNKLDEFCDLFNLTNLIRNETCFTRDHKSTIDLILTNKPKSFQNACITETGLSDFHKLILTFFQNSNYSSEAKNSFLPKFQVF